MRPACSLLLASLAWTQTLPPEVGAQNQTFDVPSGWTQTAAGPSVILTPAGAAPNSVSLFLSGRPLQGAGFREAFDQDCRALNGTLRVVEATPVQSGRQKDGVEALTSAVRLADANGSLLFRVYFAANPPGRIEMAIYTAGTRELFERYQPDVRSLLGAWTFRNLSSSAATTAAAPPPPSPRPATTPSPAAAGNGTFEAVYSGLKTSPSRYASGVSSDHLAFFADGTVCHCLPEDGLLGYATMSLRQTSPEWVGTYVVQGNRIIIGLGRGGSYQVGFERAGDTLRRITDGMSFAQQYDRRADPGLSPLGPRPLEGIYVRGDSATNPFVAQKWIRFTRAGQFEDQGIVESVASTRIVGGNPVYERARGAGSYTISHYTLRLQYADGFVRQLPIVIEPGELDKPRLNRITVNTYQLVTR